MISSSEVCSTTDSDDEQPYNEAENAEIETINQENPIDINRQAALNEAHMEYFSEIDYDDDVYSLDISNSQKILNNGIKNTTILSVDFKEVSNQINDVQIKSEEIERELKTKLIQYKTLAMQADCLSLFVKSSLKEIDNIPHDEIRHFTNDEIEKLLSS